METGITITIFFDEEGHIVKVLDAEGKRLDAIVDFKTEAQTCLKNITAFPLGASITCTTINGVLMCAKGLC